MFILFSFLLNMVLSKMEGAKIVTLKQWVQ